MGDDTMPRIVATVSEGSLAPVHLCMQRCADVCMDDESASVNRERLG